MTSLSVWLFRKQAFTQNDDLYHVYLDEVLAFRSAAGYHSDAVRPSVDRGFCLNAPQFGHQLA